MTLPFKNGTMVINGISSMATRALLAELTAAYAQRTGISVHIEAVGGVDAARRVLAGEAFDVVVLAADAIQKLLAAGAVVAGSAVGLVRSPVAMAVRAGAPAPDVGSEDAVRAAVLAADSISMSTGPSGTYIAGLFQRWGIAEQVAARTVQAPPGVPVGSLVARGDVALGFQQLSELLHLPGIQVLGPLPDAIACTTTFTGAVATTSTQPDAVRALLDALAAPDTAEAKRRHGMSAA